MNFNDIVALWKTLNDADCSGDLPEPMRAAKEHLDKHIAELILTFQITKPQ